MIYTVTFNPSLDYIISIDDFQLGKTNRTTKELMLPGGKGFNVSTVLHNLGIKNTALGFTAGFVGEELKRLAGKTGYGCDFIDLKAAPNLSLWTFFEQNGRNIVREIKLNY